jgi:hypothetical protein
MARSPYEAGLFFCFLLLFQTQRPQKHPKTGLHGGTEGWHGGHGKLRELIKGELRPYVVRFSHWGEGWRENTTSLERTTPN